jgi:hypothetical protein
MILRDYQNNLISATRNSFRTGSKAPCVVLPCGGGKTVCFAYMASEHIRIHNAKAKIAKAETKRKSDEFERKCFADAFGKELEELIFNEIKGKDGEAEARLKELEEQNDNN